MGKRNREQVGDKREAFLKAIPFRRFTVGELEYNSRHLILISFHFSPHHRHHSFHNLLRLTEPPFSVATPALPLMICL